jgi:carboxypeptidase C (cathepsin A)
MEDAAADVAAFFAILSDRFPQFQGRKLHLAGESFAASAPRVNYLLPS